MSWHDHVVWDMPVIECEDDCFAKKLFGPGQCSI